MSEGLSAIIYPVTDLSASKKVYSHVLGVEPVMDQPYYVGYRVGDLDVGLDPNGHAQGMTAPIGYWQVDDINATIAALLDEGAVAFQAVKDVGGGKLVGSVKDADGNVIGLIQPA
jgi:predicted enzyme related to lactoylglutathione lyase